MKPTFIRCKHCGEKFLPTKEEIDLHADGYAPLQEECEECFAMAENSFPEVELPSDTDNGL